MPLHLVKLSVGATSFRDLKDWIDERAKANRAKGKQVRHVHVTRMTPKRDTELLDGGSIYWVIKGEIAARQKLVAIEPFRDKDGIGRCRLVMETKLIPVSPRPMRAFQGWRYLDAKSAPPDLRGSPQDLADMPEPMRKELRELGLL
ncbi:DUF1489 family protein [Afipia felis]|jgi:hypothetical protein|uniref:Protein of uncharacterized function (DUF1489) n=2 Tax=Afipia felis TaxID=1035 RepID=A0A380W966_AFIFE|nr:DUF1489 domain-containing protein [Afipia felis]EKS27861.1 hypothetical protein HMPREF9697_00389 [Afipia felis ATCC 53690]SUU76571.1 Protein of uncharacterised function (DUF1489) [Afipia felis]SUU84637.1 Protein of uncharacterised function (DUF1489) [Afipia felis]